MKHGEVIKNIRINKTWLIVYSNGQSDYISDIYIKDAENYYLGIFCQCVEFVRRYIYKTYGVNLANYYNSGNACDWLANAEDMGLEKIKPGEAKEGDIITFTGGLYGHVGLIIKEGSSLYMVSQNFYNDSRDLKTYLQPEILSNKNTLNIYNTRYRFQAVLRMS